jgi:hypothetical protein
MRFVTAMSAKNRANGLATGWSNGTTSSAPGMRTRKNIFESAPGSGKGLEAFHKSDHGPPGASET